MSREGEDPIASVFATTMRNGSLLRLELAWSAFNGAEWAVWVCLLVYAYSVGGATAWGLMALVQLIPWIFLAPYPGERPKQRPCWPRRARSSLALAPCRPSARPTICSRARAASSPRAGLSTCR